jgi:hypothetical protein
MEEGQETVADAVLQQRLSCLLEQQSRDQELQQLLDRKTQCIFRKVAIEARSLADQAERVGMQGRSHGCSVPPWLQLLGIGFQSRGSPCHQAREEAMYTIDTSDTWLERCPLLTRGLCRSQDKAALSRAVVAREFELTKSKVDLLRWRQRSALLKVQLSSTEEDVQRYQRVGAILQRQYELEQNTKQAVQQVATAAHAVLAERGRQQAAAWRAELEGAQAALQDRQRQLGELQQELLLSSQREGELEQQLAAVQAQLEQSTAAARDRAAVLQQEASQLRADYAQLETRRATAEAFATQRLADVEELRRQADSLQREVRRRGVWQQRACCNLAHPKAYISWFTS